MSLIHTHEIYNFIILESLNFGSLETAELCF